MYCKAYDGVAFVMELILHDSEHCLVWSNISCVEILEDFIMVDSILSDLNVCTVASFVDVFKNVLLDSFDPCAHFNIHVAVELHQKIRVVGDNQGVIGDVVTKLGWVLTTSPELGVSINIEFCPLF